MAAFEQEKHEYRGGILYHCNCLNLFPLFREESIKVDEALEPKDKSQVHTPHRNSINPLQILVSIPTFFLIFVAIFRLVLRIPHFPVPTEYKSAYASLWMMNYYSTTTLILQTKCCQPLSLRCRCDIVISCLSEAAVFNGAI